MSRLARILLVVLLAASSLVALPGAPASADHVPLGGWQTLMGPSPALYGMDFVDASTGWAVGIGGAILKTADGGTTWTAQTSGTTAFLYGVDFVDADVGWAVGTGGTILHTRNGGPPGYRRAAAPPRHSSECTLLIH